MCESVTGSSTKTHDLCIKQSRKVTAGSLGAYILVYMKSLTGAMRKLQLKKEKMLSLSGPWCAMAAVNLESSVHEF